MPRIARSADGTPLLGDDEGFVPLPAADPGLRTVEDALRAAPAGLPDPAAASASRIPDEGIDFGLPFDPGKLWGMGLNYQGMLEQMGKELPEDPPSFLKPDNTVTGPSGPLRLPPTDLTESVNAECELGVVIGRTAKDVPEGEVDDVIAGYVPVLDAAAMDIIQGNPRFLTRAKAFDTFLVIGPWVVTPEEIDDLGAVNVATVANGETIAEDVTENMVFEPRETVAYHSRVMTMDAGDLIYMGSPGGYELSPGDTIGGEVSQVGEVSVPVVR